MEIIQELKDKIPSGIVIPKPNAKADFIVKGWGIRRGEEALVYRIPNHNNVGKPYEKGITVSEWRQAYTRISSDKAFERDWFTKNMSECAKEGGCNFTTIGGIFQLLGLVDYERGAYKPRKG
jgi:hypothetical protein